MLIIPALTLNNGASTDDMQQQTKSLNENQDSLWSFAATRGFNLS